MIRSLHVLALRMTVLAITTAAAQEVTAPKSAQHATPSAKNKPDPVFDSPKAGEAVQRGHEQLNFRTEYISAAEVVSQLQKIFKDEKIGYMNKGTGDITLVLPPGLSERVMVEVKKLDVPPEIQTFQLKRLKPSSAAGLLDVFFRNENMKATADSHTSSILVRAQKPQLAAARIVIEALETSAGDSAIVTVPISIGQAAVLPMKHASARDVAATLNQLFQENTNSQQAIVNRRLRIVAEPVSNSILLRASDDEFKEIEAVIRSCDVPPVMKSAVIPLKNAVAAELAAILPLKFTHERMKVATDARSNSILLEAPIEYFSNIEAYIRSVDKPAKPTTPDQPTVKPPLSLDTFPEKNIPSAGITPESQLPGDVSGQRQSYDRLESNARQLAEKLRAAGANPGSQHPDRVRLESDLRAGVAAAFEARQQLQRAELAVLQQRLTTIQQSLATRDANKEEIINRRVTELLNPTLQWDETKAEPMPSPASKPAASAYDPIAPPKPGQPAARPDISAKQPNQPFTPSSDSPAPATTANDVNIPAGLRSATDFRNQFQELGFWVRSQEAALKEQPTFKFSLSQKRDFEKHRQQLAALRDEYAAQLRLLRLDLQNAESKLKSATEELKRIDQAYRGGAITASEVGVHTAIVDNARYRLDRAMVLLELYLQVDRSWEPPAEANRSSSAIPPDDPNKSPLKNRRPASETTPEANDTGNVPAGSAQFDAVQKTVSAAAALASTPTAPAQSARAGVRTVPASKSHGVQVHITGPPGAVLAVNEEPALTVPCRRDLAHQTVHHLTFSEIPDHPNLRLSAAIAIWYVIPETEAYLQRHAISLMLTNEDLEQIAAGNTVKKVVYLSRENPKKAETVASSRLDPAMQAQAEAGQRGHVLAVLSIARRPDTNDTPLVLSGHSDIVTGVAFSRDGWRVASSSRDGTIKVWDAIAGAELLTLKRQYDNVNDGHAGYVSAVAFSPDGKHLASAGGSDRMLYIWNAVSGRAQAGLFTNGGVMGVAYSPDGTRLASASSDNTVRVWDANPETHEGKDIHSLDANMPLSVCFSPDGKRLASAGRDNTIRVWNSVTSEELLKISHSDQVTGVVFSPDGMRLATASPNGVNVWDATSGKTLLTLNGLSGISRVAYSPDGKRLASAGWDDLVKLWDANTGKELRTLKGHGNTVVGVAFSPDGNRLVTGSEDRTVRIWDVTPQE